MRSFKYMTLTAAAFALVACQETSKGEQGTSIGDVYISNAQPVQGDSLQLAFTTEEEIDNIILHYSTREKNYMTDLEFTTTGKEVNASFQVPDSATSLAFDFMKRYSALNDAVTLAVYSEEGQPLPGAMIGQAMYYNGMGKQLGHELKTDSIISLYSAELSAHPELNEFHDVKYAGMLIKAKKEGGQEILDKKIAEITASEKELALEDLKKLTELYLAMGNRAKTDSIYSLMAENYPDSDPAIGKAFNAINSMTDPKEKEVAAKEFMAAHPDHRTAQYMLSSLAQSYGRNGDYDKFTATVADIEQPESRASAMNSIAWGLAEKGEDLDEAAQISKSSIDVISKAMKAPEWDAQFTTKHLKLMSLNRSLEMYYDTYALILYKQGNIKEAIEYQGMAAGTTASGEVNERYIQFLIEDEQYSLAKEKAAEYVSHNVSTPKMREYLETAFTQQGGEGNYTDFLAALEAEARENLKAEVMKKMIDEKAKGFTLKNIEGGEVALADLKGKTVVLDFWATWCGPCIASFPGMQQAQDNYMEDENVVFLFIDTFERGTDEKRIEMTGDFIEKNDYSFTVLLDAMDEETKDFEAANNYGVTGIPTKFVIGPDGNIKFKSVGWSGSVDKLVTELDMMIELARS